MIFNLRIKRTAPNEEADLVDVPQLNWSHDSATVWWFDSPRDSGLGDERVFLGQAYKAQPKTDNI
jgi:hypothetical protein